jgi:SAM-dependent methyltransferase
VLYANQGEWRCAACGEQPALERGFTLLAPAIDDRDGFEPDAFSQLSELEAQHFWFRARNQLICSLIRRYAPAATSLFEVGCGTGFVLQGIHGAFPGLRLGGGEPSLAGLEVARQRVPGAQLLQLDAAQLPFDAEWDVVGAFDVLEHLDDDATAIAEIARAVVPSGTVVLTVPQHPWLWSADDEYGRHRRRYRRSELVGRVQAAGLEVVRVTSWMSSLLPLIAISRRRPARGEFDPAHELRQGRLTRTVLERVLQGEQALIDRGVSFPAGSSLVVVARRLPATMPG